MTSPPPKPGSARPAIDDSPPPPLPGVVLALLFDGVPEVLTTKRWAAYPVFSPPEDFAPFVLSADRSLVYLNALETAASAQEIAAIAGHNSALLIASYLEQQQRQQRGAHCPDALGHLEQQGSPDGQAAAAAAA